MPINAVNPFIRIVKGRFQSYVEVWLEQVVHRITLYNHPGMCARFPEDETVNEIFANQTIFLYTGLEKYSIDVTNVVDIRHERNFELMMRFQTLIKSGEISYTDLNGFQVY